MVPDIPRRSLDALFRPGSIAIIGASSSPSKIGALPIGNLLSNGFRGQIFPVNPAQSDILGLPCYPSIDAVGKPVDLAIVALPEALATHAVAQAADAGARACIVFSAGFAEVSEAGAAAQREIARIGHAAGMPVLGPNCLGVIGVHEGIYATFSMVASSGKVRAGGVSIVSQSGGFGVSAYLGARQRGIGLSRVVMTGNEADIDAGECIDWLADDEATRCILVFLEISRNGRRLVQALAKAKRNGKPVVVIKVGTSGIGAEAASAHTGAGRGDDAVYDAVFARLGAHRARSIEDAFDLVYALSVAPRPRGARLGILTVSGGMGILMADEAVRTGLELPPMPEAARALIRRSAPLAGVRNPVDLTGAIMSDSGLEPRALGLMLGEGGFDCVVTSQAAGSGLSPKGPGLAQQLVDAGRAFPDRMLAVCNLFPDLLRDKLHEAGVLVFQDPSRAVRTVATAVGLLSTVATPYPAGQIAQSGLAGTDDGMEAWLESVGIEIPAQDSSAPDTSLVTIRLRESEFGGVVTMRAGWDPLGQEGGEISLLAPLDMPDALALLQRSQMLSKWKAVQHEPASAFDQLASLLVRVGRLACSPVLPSPQVSLELNVALSSGGSARVLNAGLCSIEAEPSHI